MALATADGPGAPAPMEQGRASLLPRADFAFLTFVFFVSTGAMSRLGVDTLAWLMIYGIAGLYILRDFDAVAAAASDCWFALLVPFVAGLSTLWSVSAGVSLYSAIQLTVTVMIALWIGRRFEIATIFAALWIGTGIGVLLSTLNIAVGFIEAWHNGSLIGIYTQKNVFSGAVLLFFFGGAVTLALARQGVVFAALFGLCATLIVFGNSTSTLAYFAFSFSMFILAGLGGGRPAHRVLNVGYVALLGFGALGFIVFGFPQVIDSLLAAFEKDSTLTGRTVLWEYAGQVIEQRPWLGAGFNAFWDPDINGIVKAIHATVDDRLTGFHNVFIEVRVAIGMLGLVAFVLFLANAFWAALKLFVFEGGLDAAAALVLIVLAIITGFTENVMFRQHEVYQIMVVALFSAAALRNSRRVGRGMRRAEAVMAERDTPDRAGIAGREVGR